MAVRCVAGAALLLMLAACKKDPSLKATKTECDQACAHAAGLNKGTPDILTKVCPFVCIDREWTVGDVGCLNDAATYEGVQDCAVAAKVANDRGLAKYNKAEAEKAVLLAQQQQKDEEAKKLEAQLKEQSAKVERLLADLTTAKSDAERAAIQKQLEEAQEAKKKLSGTGSRGPAKECGCQPGDPLCSCL